MTFPVAEPTVCRLLAYAVGPGAWNMAVDEALLESTIPQSPVCLRFYGWSQPTLTLGYFQPYTDRLLHPASLQCPLVRRTTGGGAILHHHELTYSLCVAGGHPLAMDAPVLYRAMHGALVDVLADLGIHAELAGESRSAPQEPLLCFERRGGGDVLVAASKVAGSAQRRRRGAILQQGSVLLAQSKYAENLPGLKELSGQDISAPELQERWINRLAAACHFRWQADDLSAREQQMAKQLVLERYGSDAWTRRR